MQVIASAINAKMSEFFDAVSERYPKIKKEDLQEMWEEVSGTPMDIPVNIPAKKSAKKSTGEKAKRAPTAYQMFQKQQFPLLKEEGKTFAEISKEVSAKWKELSDEEKATYKPGDNHDENSVKKEVAKCKHIMTTGKNAGNQCTAKAGENGFCGRHGKDSVTKKPKVVKVQEEEPTQIIEEEEEEEKETEEKNKEDEEKTEEEEDEEEEEKPRYKKINGVMAPLCNVKSCDKPVARNPKNKKEFVGKKCLIHKK